MPVQFDKDGNPSYPEWSTEQKNALYELLKTFDPDQQGIDRAYLKDLKRGVGTNDLQKGLDGLIADGRLSSEIRPTANKSIKLEYFVWKAV